VSVAPVRSCTVAVIAGAITAPATTDAGTAPMAKDVQRRNGRRCASNASPFAGRRDHEVIGCDRHVVHRRDVTQ
jgi:hypothetical protein